MKPPTSRVSLTELKLMWVGYVLKVDELLPNICDWTSLHWIRRGCGGGDGGGDGGTPA